MNLLQGGIQTVEFGRGPEVVVPIDCRRWMVMVVTFAGMSFTTDNACLDTFKLVLVACGDSSVMEYPRRLTSTFSVQSSRESPDLLNPEKYCYTAKRAMTTLSGRN